MSELQSSNAPSATLLVHASSAAAVLTDGEVGFYSSFSAHPRTQQAKGLFRVVALESVTITVRQFNMVDSTDGVPRDFLRFGVVPRDTVFIEPSSKSNCVSYIPHLVDFATSTVPTDLVVKFGNGGLPFPPGLQLDLKSAEITDKHPVVFIGNIDTEPNQKKTRRIASMKLDFVLHCSGEGFGLIY